jgi:AcrR family transcriptional regulator
MMPATKDEIARKFLELALRHGYRRTAVEDVARALRISKKTIYDFFSSKADLLAYAIELWAADQRARVESMLTETTALGRLQQAVTVALADARRGYESSPHADMSEPSAELTAEVNARVFGPMVRDLIAQGVASGEFEVPDIDISTAFVIVLGTEAVRIIGEDTSRRPEAATLDAVRRLVGAGERS